MVPDVNKCDGSILMDLSKAFDGLAHNIYVVNTRVNEGQRHA